MYLSDWKKFYFWCVQICIRVFAKANSRTSLTKSLYPTNRWHSAGCRKRKEHGLTCRYWILNYHNAEVMFRNINVRGNDNAAVDPEWWSPGSESPLFLFFSFYGCLSFLKHNVVPLFQHVNYLFINLSYQMVWKRTILI